MTSSLLASALYWAAAFIIFVEGLNKLHRTELFAVDPLLRERLDALKNAPTRRQALVNRIKCFGWRLVSVADRARSMLAGGWRKRLVDCLKASAWVLLCIGAGGVLISPLIEVPLRSANVCTACGFALLIVRTRVREALFPS